MKRNILLLSIMTLIFMLIPFRAMAMSTFIPGAHTVSVELLDDLTTNNPLVFTPADEAVRQGLFPNEWVENKPKRPTWYTPDVKVPGYQITGYFEDARFVIRIPAKWNGKLVVGGMPAVRDEKSADAAFSDFVLTKFNLAGESYAYASIDKGTVGETIPTPDGKLHPFNKLMNAFAFAEKDNINDTIAEWHLRLKQVTIGAKTALIKLKQQPPSHTYLMGISNGGYVVRVALERNGDLYDGAIDWEGVFWHSEKNNLLHDLSEIIRAYFFGYAKKDATVMEKEAARQTLTKYLDEDSEFLWAAHAPVYWLYVCDAYRNLFDPSYTKRSWYEFMKHPEDYRDYYDYKNRPSAVSDAIRNIENTGKIQKPMISIFGSLDCVTPIKSDAKPYEQLVLANGKGDIYRQYIIKNGNHLDGWVGHPTIDSQNKLQPLLPYVHQAFDLLTDWVENGTVPPPSRTVGIPSEQGKVKDLKNESLEMDPY